MANRKTRIRQRLYIDSAVQGAILRQSLTHWSSALIVAFGCLLALQVASEGVNQPLTHHLDTLWSRYGTLLAVVICMFPIFAYDSVRLSHRFTGPVYALRVALHKIAEGQHIPEVVFRKDDFWNELAANVNRIAARLDHQQLTKEAEEDDSARVPELSGREL